MPNSAAMFDGRAASHREATRLRTPKLVPASTSTPGSKYYPGFNSSFVEDVLNHLQLPPDAIVIDPWNGAGTTTTVASSMGFSALGIDINPVLVVIARSRLLGPEVLESLEPLTHELLVRARRSESVVTAEDPLAQWFTAGTMRYLRCIERSIQDLLIEPGGIVDFTSPVALDRVSSLAAWFYVVLFETVRSFLSGYTSSNPTWFKLKNQGKRVSVRLDRIDARVRAIQRQHGIQLAEFTERTELGDRQAVIRLGDSCNLKVADESMEACITSPPYCTRIDYAVQTRPELAVLAVGDGFDFRRLREASIGTPTMVAVKPEQDEQWGSYTSSLLDRIATHKSKGSATYYYRYFVQYFDSMYRSMSELRRVLKRGSPCALVIQDSYYKDVRVDLARCITQMSEAIGWKVTDRVDFPVPHRRANMNPAARRYRTGVLATESLILLSA